MTIQLDLPRELELAVRRHARESGREVGSWLVGFLQDNVEVPELRATPVAQRLIPPAYPDENIGEELEYQPVQFPIVGAMKVRCIEGGPLVPPTFPDDEQ